MKIQNALAFLSERDQDLAPISGELTIVEKIAGEIVIKEGDKGKFMYIVQDGSLDIVADSKVVERVNAGGIVGEISMIDGVERSASVIAREDSTLIPIGSFRFLHLVRKHPEFSLIVMSEYSRRLSEKYPHV